MSARIYTVVDASALLRGLVTARDAAAFEEALAPIVEQAHRLATAMLQDSQAAEDAVQEASIKAWRKLDRLREGSDMRPWFLAIVANECRTTLRSRWRRSVGPLASSLASEGDVEAAALDTQETLRILRTLRHRDRLVLALHFYLDLSIEEIARVTGTSPPAAKARLYRAINTLRRRMGDTEGMS